MNQFESKEDYLERILMLNEKNGHVRAIDIANSMGFSKPSVSVALKKLKSSGFIDIDAKTGYVTLTENGKFVATSVYEKHKMLVSALIMIGVGEDQARIDACKIEHDISEETRLRIKEFVEKPR